MMRKVLSFIGSVIFMAVFAGFLTILIMEWMAGCGESYVDANGERHQYECLFLTIHNEGVKK